MKEIDVLLVPFWWDKLSDSELIARLTNRGANLDEVRAVVKERETDRASRVYIHNTIGDE